MEFFEFLYVRSGSPLSPFLYSPSLPPSHFDDFNVLSFLSLLLFVAVEVRSSKYSRPAPHSFTIYFLLISRPSLLAIGISFFVCSSIIYLSHHVPPPPRDLIISSLYSITALSYYYTPLHNLYTAVCSSSWRAIEFRHAHTYIPHTCWQRLRI